MDVIQLRFAGHRKFETLVLDKGKYYIGDICYALGEEIYYKHWGDRFNFENGLYDVDGKQFAVLSTAWGDGSYVSYHKNNRYVFPVDAGNIGMVDVALLDKSEEYLSTCGAIIEFDSDVVFSYDAGIISICADGVSISINTDSDEDDYDWNDGWDDEEEEDE